MNPLSAIWQFLGIISKIKFEFGVIYKISP